MAEVSDAELAQAKLNWQAERLERPTPSSVRFDVSSERVVVDFVNGASFIFPARSIEGLETATADELADVTLLGETGLHWEALDLDYSIAGLMNGIFGSKVFMDARRRGGQSRSEAKIAASRANGAKGGRPKKSGAGS
ncbi:DUF2442 domain-containing protein [Aliirhizobium terrae]|uniref:DUF2442 domain-containing protein n=1 Tax=Terrirhizobium terrae TaxID=2926709 RepID=UPI002576EA79|nr:DUF2442 domain-containing protein [Rhizobium sp. CC-CFT758]WJH40960.1 DUF2442 domain-containing protein [Rhizobium sp. CC-CFT758]